SIGTEHAAVARLGFVQHRAGGTFIEVPAGVDRHGFSRARAAGGADQSRLQADIQTGGPVQKCNPQSPTATRKATGPNQYNPGRAHRLSGTQARRCRHMTTEAPASRKTAPNSNSCWY